MAETPGNDRFANRRRGFANGARRGASLVLASSGDALSILSRPRLWATCALLTALFAAIGPFGTLDRLDPPARLAYWGVVMGCGWTLATLHVALATRLLPQRWPGGLRAALGGAAMTPILMQLVGWLNAAVFGTPFELLPDLSTRLAVFVAAGATVTLLSRLVDPETVGGARPIPVPVPASVEAPGPAARGAPPRLEPMPLRPAPRAAPRPAPPETSPAEKTHPVPRPSTPQPPAPGPAILDRLPPAKRGRLLRLSMQDHYVEIVTEAGAGLALLRLSDAIAEAAPTPGLQVHRSHWVAEAAVAGARRGEGRLRLVLTDGAEIPVSRARAADVRAAGWLGPVR